MGEEPTRAEPPRRSASARDLRTLFRLVLGIWALLPLIHLGSPAEDAVPFVLAGDVEPDQLYPVDGDADALVVTEPYAAAYCDALGDDADCAARLTPYVSTPAALPFTVAVGSAGSAAGVFAMRVIAAAALVGGMLLLWARLAPMSPDAPRQLFVVVAALTPLASVTVQLGQTTPLVFLLLCLGVSATSRPTRLWATAGLVALTTALKVFPGVALVVAALQRRWRLVGLGLLGLVLLVGSAALVTPLDGAIDQFLASSASVTGWAVRNPYNASIDQALLPGGVAFDGAPSAAAVVAVGIRAAVAVGLWAWASRRASDDASVAVAMALVLVVLPVVWWHYAWVAIAAIALCVADGRAHRSGVLVGAAVVSAPISLLFLVGRLPALQALAWLGLVAAALVVLASERDDLPRASVDTATRGDR